jgi:hypothetical protein
LVFQEQLGTMLGSSWIDTFLSSGHFDRYLTSIALIYAAFAAGDWLGKRRRPRVAPPPGVVSLKVLAVLAGIGLILTMATSYQAREILLQGHYATDTDSEGTRGAVVASCIFLFTIALMYAVRTKPTKAKQLLANTFMMCWWPIGLIILISGTRLYFISFLLMLLVYWTVYVRPIALRSFVGALASSILLAGVVGVYRMGDGTVLGNILGEPIYTSFSLLAFLANGDLHYVNVPTYLASDLINLAPTVLLPNKDRLIHYIPDVYSPLGALNSYVSFDSNFGLVGTAILMLLFAFGMRCLRRRSGAFSAPAYVMISGWSAFALFRDPFAISIVKDILEFSILIPAAICTASFWLRWSGCPDHEPAPQ